MQGVQGCLLGAETNDINTHSGVILEDSPFDTIENCGFTFCGRCVTQNRKCSTCTVHDRLQTELQCG